MKRYFLAPFVATLLLPVALEAEKFYPDDPLARDDELVDTLEKPVEIELSDLYDRLGHVFKDWGASPIGSEASNVNTLDEVPDSSWFTNRHGRERMSIEELVRGPDRGLGPDPSETWTVFRGKSQGLTPGFQIYDAKGDRYVIKLDPIEVPELASAAEVIATKIYYALGYNVPENYIVRVHPDSFAIEPGTEVEDSFGDKMPLTRFRFNRMIRRVPRLADGTMRVTASKYIPGVPIGPFRYFETRSDDPNDIIPHEDRRELRGLRLIGAWTNHDDTRAQNTQDTWVGENGRHIVKHFLMDFGSTFGSGSVDMQARGIEFPVLDGLQGDEAKSAWIRLPGSRLSEGQMARFPRLPSRRSVRVGAIRSRRLAKRLSQSSLLAHDRPRRLLGGQDFDVVHSRGARGDRRNGGVLASRRPSLFSGNARRAPDEVRAIRYQRDQSPRRVRNRWRDTFFYEPLREIRLRHGEDRVPRALVHL